MIRDPSDGSVRGDWKDDDAPTLDPSNPVKPIFDDPEEAAKWRIVIPDTGLRQPTRTDAQERLERSRQWLKTYHSKHGEKSDDVVRGDDESELPSQS